MRSELIDRKAVNNAIEKSIELFPDAFACGLRLAQRIVADTPAEKPNVQCIAEIKINRDDIEKLVAEKVEEIKASIEKRKRGRWVWNKNGMDWGLGAWCCSECGIKAETWWATDKRDPLGCAGMKFCGNCGADMRA